VSNRQESRSQVQGFGSVRILYIFRHIRSGSILSKMCGFQFCSFGSNSIIFPSLAMMACTSMNGDINLWHMQSTRVDSPTVPEGVSAGQDLRWQAGSVPVVRCDCSLLATTEVSPCQDTYNTDWVTTRNYCDILSCVTRYRYHPCTRWRSVVAHRLDSTKGRALTGPWNGKSTLNCLFPKKNFL